MKKDIRNRGCFGRGCLERGRLDTFLSKVAHVRAAKTLGNPDRGHRMIAVTGVLAIFASLLFASCADEDGMHNNDSPQAMVTFKFENMGSGVNGSFAIPGDFANGNDWDETETNVKMKAGEGVSDPIEVRQPNISFTLVNAKGWSRLSWFPAVKGNKWDEGKQQNFEISDLPLESGEFTILIRGDPVNTVPVVEE